MALTRRRTRRTVTGARYKPDRKKKKYELSGNPTLTVFGEAKIKVVKKKGGKKKGRVLRSNILNVFNPKTKRHQKTKIKKVLENPSNRYYTKRNIITKGTIVETELGKAKVTSRPGQDGALNGILLS